MIDNVQLEYNFFSLLFLFDLSPPPPATFRGFNSAVTSPDDVADVHGDEELDMVHLTSPHTYSTYYPVNPCWIRFCTDVPGAS